ncbi:MAG: hypothetical protein ACD_10C00629G0001 [uncultured bacterium]|nr:MAG: hypothetical protein ACD_10C00629G0001 [uncultured bacterium]
MSKLGIGFGTTVLGRGLATSGIDGIGGYTKSLLDCLVTDPGLDICPFAFGSGGLLPKGMVSHRLPRFSMGSLSSLLLGKSYSGSQSLSRRVDVIHATDHLIPRITGVPVVATLMDAIPLAHPEWVNYRFATLKNSIWRKTAGFADHVITISEYSKEELIRFFGLSDSKISVVPLGVDGRWFAKPTAEQLRTVRVRYRLPKNFLVFVGTLQPRKNVTRIIDAHRSLPAATRASYPLLLIGRAGWQCAEIDDQLRVDDRQVQWLNYVPGEDLPVILRCASGLVFPSLHEGFGLPVLEAFAAELPVITSCITSLPEVAGNAALLVDPYCCEQIAWAMQQIIDDAALVSRLRREGLSRAREFTWARTTQATIEIYRRLVACR